jgi:hypothetical protein
MEARPIFLVEVTKLYAPPNKLNAAPYLDLLRLSSLPATSGQFIGI